VTSTLHLWTNRTSDSGKLKSDNGAWLWGIKEPQHYSSISYGKKWLQAGKVSNACLKSIRSETRRLSGTALGSVTWSIFRRQNVKRTRSGVESNYVSHWRDVGWKSRSAAMNSGVGERIVFACSSVGLLDFFGWRRRPTSKGKTHAVAHQFHWRRSSQGAAFPTTSLGPLYFNRHFLWRLLGHCSRRPKACWPERNSLGLTVMS
jgi:hypothetical protein